MLQNNLLTKYEIVFYFIKVLIMKLIKKDYFIYSTLIPKPTK
jgi:hypothetical protein